MRQFNKASRSARRSGSSNGISKAQMAGLMAVPLTVISAGSFAAMKYMAIEKQAANYCFARDDQPVVGIFVDGSIMPEDSPEQLRDIKSAFMQSYATAASNTKFTIFEASEEAAGSLPQPTFTICKPPANSAQLEAIGAPEQSPAYAANKAKKAKEAFSREVDRIVSDFKSTSNKPIDSPLLEQIKGVLESPDFRSPQRTFVIITDGIQNSPAARFCFVKNDMPPFAAFSGRDDYAFVKPPSMKGVDVKLRLVEWIKLPTLRAKHCTNDEVRRWWPDYFQANGAESVHVSYIRVWGQE